MSSSSNIHQTRKEKKKTIDTRLSCLFFREKEKKYLFLHIKTTHLSLSVSSRSDFISFHEKEVKEEEEDSKEFIDVRRASETASKSAARRVMFALGRYEHCSTFSFVFFLGFVFFHSCEKSTRFRYTFFMMRCARFVRFCSAM